MMQMQTPPSFAAGEFSHSLSPTASSTMMPSPAKLSLRLPKTLIATDLTSLQHLIPTHLLPSTQRYLRKRPPSPRSSRPQQPPHTSPLRRR
jgi:hypothetical protein